jgi:hypothetical protein
METLLQQANDKASIQSALDDKPQITELLSALPINEQKGVERKIQSLTEQQSKKLTSLKTQQKQQQFIDIFYILKNSVADEELSEQISVLPKVWQTCFTNNNVDINRQELTIKMEILADIESPKDELSIRQNMQMQLMAQKLQTGESVNLNDLLKDWISAGILDKESQLQLPRLEKIFLQ